MKISRICLENFKGIKELELDLNCKSTVFFGINGVGKTTVLYAVNMLFSNIINKIVSNRFKQGVTLNAGDITFGASDCKICVEFCLDDGSTMQCTRRIEKNGKKNQANINEFCSKFTSDYLHSESASGSENIPIFVNYGVHRLVTDVRLGIRNSHIFDNLSAFENAIESKIDFGAFFEWFRYQEDLENQIKVSKKDLNFIDPALNSVKNAIEKMLGNVENLRVERNPLAMMVDKGGVTLQIEQLSDGEKCALALVGDLARRTALANPTMANPSEGKGIVLIDEVELHMHTQWQRKILPLLNELFPNIQFIISTHSPQVLGELDDTYNIFALSKQDNHFNCTKINSLMAWDSNLILEELMGTDSLNTTVKARISEVFSLIENKKYIEARNLADEIDSTLNYPNPDTVKARVLIARGLRYEENH